MWYLVSKHGISTVWGLMAFLGGMQLVVSDLPDVFALQLFWDNGAFGFLGIVLGAMKLIAIVLKWAWLHHVLDLVGIFWFVYLGCVLCTTIPPMWFTAVLLLVMGMMIAVRQTLVLARKRGG
ncbi:hypothetical protein C6P08_06815 [Weissella confusa]|uniref:hypothetical protein n=1 Tax=Weissella confusa TaxID=1583 RepID=UPI0010929A07|nr:hypothetical protein [Weissella confusa]MBJ7694274.1 hypothetical protein [Weissella confusa]QBZ04909.1 hypothetical protein C6P08_06815 [Weissella confusa]